MSENKCDLFASALAARPSERQYKWMKMEMCAFVHLSLNTFYDKEWGDGTEDPALFDPVCCDTDSWCKLFKECGFKLAILTCKHHGGFCLWPSKYTDYSVKNSPWKDGQGDLVREFSDSCRKYGLKFGVYLSPWDRHDKRYAVDSAAYNRYFLNQLTELLTNYGEVSEVWFDGACVPVNNMVQEYAWSDYYSLIRKLQPDAVISGIAPDVRWCGNEAGKSRPAEWAVVDLDRDYYAFNRQRSKDHDIGRLGSNMVWYPSEVDTSIRPNWFYHKSDDVDVKSMYKLLNIYFNSVGHNSVLLLNIPPDHRGQIHRADADRLREMHAWLTLAFQNDLAEKARFFRESVKIASDGFIEECFCLELPEKSVFDCVELAEDILQGQRVESYRIYIKEGDLKIPVGSGFTIGSRELKRLPQCVACSKLYLEFTSRAEVKLLPVKLYKLPPFPAEETATADLYFWNVDYHVPEHQGGSPENLKSETPYISDPGAMPQRIEFTCRQGVDFQGLAILPQQDDSTDGTVRECSIEITCDNQNWQNIFSGELGNLQENRVFCKLLFPQNYYGVKGLRFIVHKTFNGENYFKLQRLLPILLPENK